MKHQKTGLQILQSIRTLTDITSDDQRVLQCTERLVISAAEEALRWAANYVPLPKVVDSAAVIKRARLNIRNIEVVRAVAACNGISEKAAREALHGSK